MSSGVAIVELAMAEGRLPVEDFYGTINLCAFLIALVFLFVDWRYHFASTSVALFPLVFLMTLVAGMRQPVSAWGDDEAQLQAFRDARDDIRARLRAWVKEANT